MWSDIPRTAGSLLRHSGHLIGDVPEELREASANVIVGLLYPGMNNRNHVELYTDVFNMNLTSFLKNQIIQ